MDESYVASGRRADLRRAGRRLFRGHADEWEAFLADAALAGRIVYQHKQLSESLTGRVELAHLSENNFGSLVPMRGWFHLKSLADFIVAVALLPLRCHSWRCAR